MQKPFNDNYNTMKASKKIKFKLAYKSPIISTLNFGGSKKLNDNSVRQGSRLEGSDGAESNKKSS